MMHKVSFCSIFCALVEGNKIAACTKHDLKKILKYLTKYIGYAHIAGLYVCLHANVLRSIPRLVATCM